MSSIAEAPATVRLADYRPPAWRCETVELLVELFEDHALVTATTHWTRVGQGALELDGRELTTEALVLDGQQLDLDAVLPAAGRLRLEPAGDTCVLQAVTRLRPQENTALEGLYRSGRTYCTQMEAEGFRRVTWFADRPDVLAVWTTTIVADRQACPVLLANGNLIDAGEAADGRHHATWHDPHPKPAYLFALVAGDLARIDDRFTTRSGREVALQVFVDPGEETRAGHAMASLKRSMAWDEQVYGREYDLDIFMLVAVHDFNMGAMENKGLNIFNAALVLADPATTTDDDYHRIEGVVGHEYFHNWSGNRVTCRDWFQLSLKEGLTVFRDQQFSADMGSAAVQRIRDVRDLRSRQFPEDAGPGSHPIRPTEYITIDNFYTATVYEKGAEVIRMLHVLLGPQAYRAGTDLYFARHDGQAVTTEDFVAALAEASGRDLDAFRRWYDQPGTPRVTARWEQDLAAGTFTLSLEQHNPKAPGAEPLVIPVRAALLGPDGADLDVRPEGGGEGDVLVLDQARQAFRWSGVSVPVVPSLLRGFSAPVRLEAPYDDEQLAFLARHDGDLFNRWEAVQRLATGALLALAADHRAGRTLATPEALHGVVAGLLDDEGLDPAFAAVALELPEESVLGDACERVDVDALHAAREHVASDLCRRHRAALLTRYRDLDPAGDDQAAAGRRALRGACLDLLMREPEGEVLALCQEQFERAATMTEQLGALEQLAHVPGPARDQALAAFAERWADDQLVMNKWFAAQARSRAADTIEVVRRLAEHPAFDAGNPNKLRALYRTFAQNQAAFHGADGAGHALLGDLLVALDGRNPVLAGRLATAFAPHRRFDEDRAASMRAQLQRLLDLPGVSDNCYEVASKALAAD